MADIVLRNEVLYSDSEQTIYKTINTNKTRYGLFSDQLGTLFDCAFLHIFEFEEEANSMIAITLDEDFIGIDTKGKLLDLNSELKNEIKIWIIKSSRCNCYGVESNFKYLKSRGTLCGLCDDHSQLIYNRYGLLNNFNFWE